MYFRIDLRDRVAAIGDEWTTVARESGADQLFAGAEVGKPYRDFIRSSQIAEVYRTLFALIRLQRIIVRIPVRADTVREKRFFELEIEAVEDGAIDERLTLERTEPRSPGNWTPPPEEDEMIRMCSFCQCAQWDMEWLGLEQAIRAGDLFGGFTHWQISHGSCPDCLKERLAEITGG